MMTRLAAAAFVLLLGVAGMGAHAQTAPVQPAAPSCKPQPVDVAGAQGFTYKTVAGRDLRLHVFSPAAAVKARPAILFFFGGGWRLGDVRNFQDQARMLQAHGYVTVLADYRVTCRDQSGPPDSVADAEDAYRWLRTASGRLGVDPKRIMLSGGSAGGHLAMTAAMQAPAAEKPAALVLFNPVVDLVTIAPTLHLTRDQAAKVSPSVLPVGALPPTVIFHGKADRTVPIATVEAFCARATAAGRVCELHEYEGQDHGFYQSRAYDPAIKAAPYNDTLARTLAFLDRLGLGGQD